MTRRRRHACSPRASCRRYDAVAAPPALTMVGGGDRRLGQFVMVTSSTSEKPGSCVRRGESAMVTRLRRMYGATNARSSSVTPDHSKEAGNSRNTARLPPSATARSRIVLVPISLCSPSAAFLKALCVASAASSPPSSASTTRSATARSASLYVHDDANRRAMSTCFSWHAQPSGDSPLEPGFHQSMRVRMSGRVSSRTTSRCPVRHATCRTVSPSLSVATASRSSWRRSSSTTRTWPYLHAAIRGVSRRSPPALLMSIALRRRTRLSSSATTRSCPFAHAHHSGVSPSSRARSTSM
mmetsp:Transcript_15912/g.55400  ORF Transcript_15912/g.55400 Transcript_15912/m.55400 type:complete len:297 (+) Transcript_15912:223-1113(+)